MQDHADNQVKPANLSRKQTHLTKKSEIRKKRRKKLLLSSIAGFLGMFVWLYFTEMGLSLRYFMADTIIITQHRHWAAYLIGEERLKERVKQFERRADDMASVENKTVIHIPSPAPEQPKKLDVQYEAISGNGWRGYLLTINDPKKVRVIVTSKRGTGEKVSDMVKRTNAIAGVNAGGFVDTNWKGNGYVPIGVVVSGGQTYFNGLSNKIKQHIVGIDKNGKMVAGKYSQSEFENLGLQEAVTFSPRFIVNGVGQIDDPASGWGIAPRTTMAQREDGAILFTVIDGRQKSSIGASLYDIQELLLSRGAVIAANLDGGASSVFVYKGEVMNKPASSFGERYVPTAFLVFDEPERVINPNIWDGQKRSEMDPVTKKYRKQLNYQ